MLWYIQHIVCSVSSIETANVFTQTVSIEWPCRYLISSAILHRENKLVSLHNPQSTENYTPQPPRCRVAYRSVLFRVCYTSSWFSMRRRWFFILADWLPPRNKSSYAINHHCPTHVRSFSRWKEIEFNIRSITKLLLVQQQLQQITMATFIIDARPNISRVKCCNKIVRRTKENVRLRHRSLCIRWAVELSLLLLLLLPCAVRKFNLALSNALLVIKNMTSTFFSSLFLFVSVRLAHQIVHRVESFCAALCY